MSGGWDVAWQAPAKLNLMLHVLGRRPDGYHRLQTVFRMIDLCDELRFSPRTDGRICRRDALPGVAEEDDLCVRAAWRLREHAGVRHGVEIGLRKRIPLQGGLGGGSSDAATVLCALNRLWQLELPVAELMHLGLALGADVPVFIAGQNAWAEGVGERLTPLELPAQDYLVVQPDCAVSTAEIFAADDLTRSTPPLTIRRFLAGEGGNDCTAPVTRRHPQVAAALEWLSGHGTPRLSGTGACVFLPCPLATARELRSLLPARWRGWAVRGLAQSPLRAQLEACRDRA
jgi:4-diphosphocytidyl-2-C-methyl-D-erythritol kinase